MSHGTARAAAAVLGCALLGGCAGTVQVTPLATGQVAVAAYELRGRDPAVLLAEAGRLCHGAGVVVRQSGMSRQLLGSDGLVGHWLNQASELVLLPTREAQLMVRCEPQPDSERLLPAPSMSAPTPASTYASQRSTGRGASTRTGPAKADSAVPYGY